MPKRRHLGIEAKDFVHLTGSSSKKRARLLAKLQILIGRARFLAVREQLPDEPTDFDSDELEPQAVSKPPADRTGS